MKLISGLRFKCENQSKGCEIVLNGSIKERLRHKRLECQYEEKTEFQPAESECRLCGNEFRELIDEADEEAVGQQMKRNHICGEKLD